ncbi:glycoside hydrolase [Draconibacterium sediminis]|uniref:glycoside hydrolase n=1 Tax=Draconibacterium sediminis TaxID=1544798 RepID=UPI0006972CC4|nr:glycoside hydrolase [Draconibacterium sediminis]
MHLLLKLNITIVIISVFSANLFGQNNIEPIAYYSFNNDNVADEKEYSELFLRNQTSLYNDSERGTVLRFSSDSKSYAAFNKQLLDSDSCTISFFFYWENTNAGSWHQLFELHDATTNSNLFFTPQNGWGNNMCSLISQNKEYGTYDAVSARPLLKNYWMHIAITFQDKLVTVYIDGVAESKGYLNFTPESITTDSLFLGGNPHRSDNFYISARLDDIKIFDKALAANQILALSQGTDIPAPENAQTVWETSDNPIQLEIDLADKKQTIKNFGSSDGWNTQRIGKYWPEDKKEKLAELLFSAEKDTNGNPKGIGLSAWRFNIGAGTAEQGDASRISSEHRRTEGFLNNDGTYNWEKQIGQQWFLKKAALDYKINHIIGWQNSPPVQYTKNNLGFRDYGTPMETILKPEYFDDFAKFLADVTQHFESEGIHFDYISPLNEPQYGWAPETEGGTVSQEGTPWTNQEIHDVVVAIDNEFSTRNLDTKLFISEAGSVHYHTSGTGHASNQLYKFWNQYSTLSLVGKPSFANIVSYHSYWKDFGTELVYQREELYDRSQTLTPVPEAWQTEYSLLGNGYRTGYPDGYKLTEMECALALSKVIGTDLNVANITGWQWWSTFGLGKHNGESRFCIIEALTKDDNSDGEYHLNKLFYSLGNFSHFIRPGMTRLGTFRSDNLSAFEQTSDVIFSSFTNSEENKLVVVAVNVTEQARKIKLSLKNNVGKSLKKQALYLTDKYTNLSKQQIDLPNGELIIPAHSVVTYTADLELETSSGKLIRESGFKAWCRSSDEKIIVSFNDQNQFKQVKLYSISGKLITSIQTDNMQEKVSFQTASLPEGVYLVTGEGNNVKETHKVVVTKQ